jgi:hypothetical protein
MLLFLLIAAMLLGGIAGLVYLKAGDARATRVIELTPQR